jgi:type II secretory pathway pseudopilin PulG
MRICHSYLNARRSAFSLKELLIVIGVLGILFAIMLPQIQSAREAARRNRCQSHLKQIALALLNFDDKRKCLPPISSNGDLTPDIPGDASITTDGSSPQKNVPSPGAGYSWIVHILPEMEEGPFLNRHQN